MAQEITFTKQADGTWQGSFTSTGTKTLLQVLREKNSPLYIYISADDGDHNVIYQPPKPAKDQILSIDIAEGALITIVSHSEVTEAYYIASELDYYTKDEIDDKMEQIHQFEPVVASSLPTASADTMYKFYFIPKQSAGEQTNTKEEWMTVKEGSTYRWEKVGDTDVDLSDYVTTEDLETTLATFENRDADAQTGKMGYKILDPMLTLAEQLTEANTIYEIRDVFVVNETGNTDRVTIPSNSTLKFNGGLIQNCTIVGDNTTIDCKDIKCFDNVLFSGTFKNKLNACWVGAMPNDSTFDNSFVLQNWFNSYYSSFPTIEFPTSSYTFKSPVQLTQDKRNLRICGNYSQFSIDIADVNDEGQCFISLLGTGQSGAQGGENFLLENIRFTNARTTSGYSISKTSCLMFNRTQRFYLTNVYIAYFDVAIHIRDIFYGGFSGQCILHQNRIGIYVDRGDYSETNTIDFHNIIIKGCSVATAQSMYPQNDGETDESYNLRTAVCGIDFHALSNGCKFYGCTIEQTDYGIRFNWEPAESSLVLNNGIVTIDSCYFESTRTYEIYFGKGYVYNPNNYANYFKFYHICNITHCRFATKKECYFCGGLISFLDNQSCTVHLDTQSSNPSTYLVYNNDVKVDCSAYTYATRIGSYPRSALSTNSYDQLMTLANAMGNQYTADLTLSDSNNFNTNDQIFIPNEGNLGCYNTYKHGDVIMPLNAEALLKSSATFVHVVSGKTKVRTSTSIDALRTTMNTGGLNLRSFISKWKNGESYVGRVAGLFSYSITANPGTGLVTKTSDGSIVGFGIKAIADGTYPRATTTSAYYVFIDALVNVYMKTQNSIRNEIVFADYVQCGRTYSELRTSVPTTNATLRNQLLFVGTTTERNNVAKRLNMIFYDTTESKLKIYNGTEWVDMTNPWTRYVYNNNGKSITERASIPDLVGQEYFNMATGIKYTFRFGSSYTPIWMSSIGNIESLDHPNGYDATTNPIEYATELSAGEMVMYNGSIIKWNGTDWVNLDGTALT